MSSGVILNRPSAKTNSESDGRGVITGAGGGGGGGGCCVTSVLAAIVLVVEVCHESAVTMPATNASTAPIKVRMMGFGVMLSEMEG